MRLSSEPVTRAALLAAEHRDANACQVLWVTVVERALQEAVVYHFSTEARSRAVAEDAWAWLFSPRHERSFVEVFANAGLEPGWVREQAKRFWATKDYRYSFDVRLAALEPWRQYELGAA